MRSLTAAVLAELTKGTVSPVLIFKLSTSTGDVLIWNGIGDLIFGGQTYKGLGDLVSVNPISETEDVRAEPLTVTVSGIPSASLSIALGSQYQGRQASMWQGFLGPSGLIADPILIFRGKADVMVIDEGPETSSITVTAESRLADLQRSRIRRYTDQDQQQLFPGDLGLEFVAVIQNTEVVWSE